MGQNELIELKSGHLRLIVRKSESFVFYATFVAGEYNKIRLRADDTVIDAGANIGDYTVKAASVVKKGKVVAVEPNSNNVEILRKNLVLNKLSNVIILPYGLSDVSGVAKLSGDSVGASIMKEDESSKQIKTITIENVLKTYCPPDKDVVLKMDIEGAEALVFENPSFLDRIRELSIELHGESNVKNIPKILRDYNYDIKEFKLSDQIKNTLHYIFSHPVSFISAELKTDNTALIGFVKALQGYNPIPSVGSEQLKLLYARKL